jgi:hypothetical protein
MRVSTPQSLIDTDFEYGTQPTKWESIGLQNNRQSCYYNHSSPLIVSAITGTATADQVTITYTGTIPNNVPIYIQNSTNSTINQWGYILTGGSNTTSTIIFAPGTTTTTNAAAYYSATTTYVYLGNFYSNCGIQLATTTAVAVTSATLLTVTTTGSHGLSRGSLIYITGLTGTTTGQLGAFVVASVPTSSTFTVTATGAAGPSANTVGNINLYARPSGYVEPRAFDGGVAFSAGGAVPDQALIRQTRRYFRYQSGKGIQFSTGSSLQPPLFTTSLISSSGTVTVTTRFNHNLVVGTTIQVVGANQGGFNGTYTVATVPSPTTFTYVSPGAGSATATGVAIKVTPTKWYGSSSRLGFFDNQNGMFFEYDGTTLYTVWRNSVQQLNGSVAVTQGSGAVTGTGTAFLSQVQTGQFIVIRGQSYRIVNITNDTTMSISPEYRGQSITGAVVSMTIDTKTPQSKWSDPCDGTGASGYKIDLTRMQMWYIDYSWYGAGFVRWGLRANNGQIVYVNQQTNNNARFEAYLRSGNMSAHYEVSGIAPTTYPTQALAASGTTISANILITSTTIPVTDTSKFNSGGGVARLGAANELVYYGSLSTTTGAGNLLNCVRGFGGTAADDQTSGAAIDPSSIQVADTTGFAIPAAGSTNLIKVSNPTVNEYITYSGITNTGLIYGLTRAQTGGSAAQAFAAGVVTGVQYASTDAVPSLSHWGSSAIMDGLFNDDKSLLFNYGVPVKLTTTTSITQVTPILAIRLAPSVDNGQTGILGNKEIINRMQLQLFELGIYATGPLLVQLILNGYSTGVYSTAFQAPLTQGAGATTSSLAQVAANVTNSVTLVGGESVAAAFTNTNGQTTLDLAQVRDLGNSILGGGNTNTVPTSPANVYPDGPDVLYVCVTPLTGVATDVYARLTWKEAQA